MPQHSPDYLHLYAGLGWRVVPVHSPGKHPRIRNWVGEATSEIGRILAWFRKWPDSNIGIATGRDSGLIALDIDEDRGGSDLLAELEKKYGPLPPTVESLTGGGGRHVLFAYPDDCEIRNGNDALGAGIDLRGDGGLIVVPPSMHVSGRRYEWDVSCRPGEADLAHAPGWLLELLRNRHRARGPIADEIPEGRRNSTLTRAAGSMLRIGLTAEEMEPSLRRVNERRCRPWLDPEEVASIARSIGSRSQGPRWLMDPHGFFSSVKRNDQLVLRALCDYANDKGRCFPGMRMLAANTGLAPNTVNRAIKRLEKSGRIEVQRSRSGGRPNVNRYRILWSEADVAATATELPAVVATTSSMGEW